MRTQLFEQSSTACRLVTSVCLIGLLTACSSSSSGEDTFVVIKPDVPADQKKPRTFTQAAPYNAQSAFKDVLKNCYKATEETECNFEQLPLIGQSSTNPQVSDIMDRVITSHDWMGVRFEQVLTQMPSEALGMFKPVAIIFIGSEVDRSTYEALGATVVIDPETLWLTADEKTAISRSNSGGGNGGDDPDANGLDDLQFRTRYAYTKSGVVPESKASADEREFNNIFDRVALNLYARLAYAADLFPASVYLEAQPLRSPLQVFDDNSRNRLVSVPLYNDSELTVDRSTLYGVAYSYFDGDAVEESYKQLTALDAGAIFDAEGKPRLWAYSRQFRDTQELFTMGMMKYKHDTSLYVLFIDGQDPTNESSIGYGIKNRIASPKVAARTKFVMEKYIGSSPALDRFFESGLGTVEYIAPGTTYGEYLDEIFPARTLQALTAAQLSFGSNKQ